jgi:ParB family chromosome partitioning protein
VTPREIDEVPIDMVVPNPNQPRTNFKKDELEELAESIKRNGLLQPILVRKVGDTYQIIAGERRWQACKKIGMKTVPVRIKDVNDEDTIVLALVENIQRSDLNPIEEAYGYRRMMERGRMTQTQIAQAVSKGRSTIANALRLLDLPEDAQQLLFEEKITAGHARAILSVPTAEGRAKLTEKLVEEQLSVRETETIARLMSGKKEEKKIEREPQPKSYKTVARSLRDTLQTDVRVKSVKGKNRIEISFKDEADLERLFRIITSE